MRLPMWVRVALVYEVATAAFVGLWALAAPRSFYDDFPGLGMHWAVVSGPYNEHFVRDVGAFYLGFAVLFVWALVRPSLSLVRAVAAAFAVVQVPHTLFHAMHKEGLSDGEWVLQVGGLVVALVVAVALAARFSEPGGSTAPSR